MLLRRINAIISLLTTVFLLNYAIRISVWMLSGGSVEQSSPIASWVLVGLMALHAFISIYFAVCSLDDGERRKIKSYPKMNGATIFQRASGLLLILFTALHVASVMGAMKLPEIAIAVLFPIFFTIALAHTAISTGKAFITLGIGNAKLIKGVNAAMGLICAATLVADIVGFYLYVC